MRLEPVLLQKYEKLRQLLAEYESVLVAYSGGCDSSFLAKVLREIKGMSGMLAVTTRNEALPQFEVGAVQKFIKVHGIPHAWVETGEMQDERYTSNPVNRCFFCKSHLYDVLVPMARERGLTVVVNGMQQDDLGDWRPGMEAARQYGVRSPLLEAGLNKKDVRELSRSLGLETWNKPAAPCLSSRIPYGEAVSPAKLRQIDAGEQLLREAGFKVVRLRHYGSRAVIEIDGREAVRLEPNETLKEKLRSDIRNLGFDEVIIDPAGYRSGRLNESIWKKSA